MAVIIKSEGFIPGTFAPIAKRPRAVAGGNSIARHPDRNPSRPAAQRAPWAAPISIDTPNPVVPGIGDALPFAASPAAVKKTAPLVSGVATNVRAAVVTGQAPPKSVAPPAQLPGTKKPEPIRIVGFPVPGRKKGGAAAKTAKTEQPADGRRVAPDPTREWGKRGRTPIPVPMRRGEIDTMIAPRATGPLPAWAPGAANQPGGVAGKSAGVGFKIGAAPMSKGARR